MPLINIDRVINNPRLSQDIQVVRTTGTFVNGDFTPSSTEEILMNGVITIAKDKELVQLPEGDRVKGAINIYTRERIYTTSLAQLPWDQDYYSDEITWRDTVYKVMNTEDKRDYGFFKSLAIRKLGA